MRPTADLVDAVRGFHWFNSLSRSERLSWLRVLDSQIYIAACVVGKLIYLHFFRREQQAAERAAFKDALRHGRVKRMSFAARWLFILCTLGLVIFGWIASGPDRTRLLVVAVPLFLLFCAVELNIIVHPGETVLPDARDELLAFFKARMLQAGYVASIAALVVRSRTVSLFRLCCFR